MTGTDIFEVINTMRAEGRPFCLATVVRTADLTSAKAGAKAVVTSTGEIVGHLGGNCVRGAVKRAAADVLEQGSARMISVGPRGGESGDLTDADRHISGCPSGGTVEVFIEPYLLAMRLAVVGETPIARAIRAHGSLMGYAVSDASVDQAAADAIIIASQGAGDLAALRGALAGDAAFVAMVASHKKAAFLTSKLAKEGIDPARLETLISPAGLDLGAIDPHEIAVSILAQLVAWRRGH
ncbi:MAG: XdhC family protein [Pseudomonadota bacterium]